MNTKKEKIQEILEKSYLSNTDKTDEIIELFSTCRKTCHRNVFQSYAKTRNKNIFLLINGYDTTSPDDMIKYQERFNKYKNQPVGTEFSLKELKNDGEQGYDDRDVLSLLVCMGLFNIKTIIREYTCPNCNAKFSKTTHCTECNTQGKPTDMMHMYERIDGGVTCEYMRQDKLQLHQCLNKNCNHLFYFSKFLKDDKNYPIFKCPGCHNPEIQLKKEKTKFCIAPHTNFTKIMKGDEENVNKRDDGQPNQKMRIKHTSSSEQMSFY